MRRTIPAGRVALVLTLLAAGVPRVVAGQGRVPQVLTVGGGVSHYKLSGLEAGTSWVLDIRFDGRIGPYVIFEPGAAYLRFRTSQGERNYLLPELSLQVQGYLGPVRPFIGGGVGFANLETGANDNQFTVHAVSGVRIPIGTSWGIRLEARGRAIDPWNGKTLDITVGLMRVIPPTF